MYKTIFEARTAIISDIQTYGFGSLIDKPKMNGRYETGSISIYNPGGIGEDNEIRIYFNGSWKTYGYLKSRKPYNVTWVKKDGLPVSPVAPHYLNDGDSWIRLMPDGTEVKVTLENGSFNDSDAELKKKFIIPFAKVYVDNLRGSDENDGTTEVEAMRTLSAVADKFKNVFNLSIVLTSNYSLEGGIVNGVMQEENVKFMHSVSFFSLANNISLYHTLGTIEANIVNLNSNIVLSKSEQKGLFSGNINTTLVCSPDIMITGREGGSYLASFINGVVSLNGCKLLDAEDRITKSEYVGVLNDR